MTKLTTLWWLLTLCFYLWPRPILNNCGFVCQYSSQTSSQKWWCVHLQKVLKKNVFTWVFPRWHGQEIKKVGPSEESISNCQRVKLSQRESPTNWMIPADALASPGAVLGWQKSSEITDVIVGLQFFGRWSSVVVAWPWKLKPLILSYSRQSLACGCWTADLSCTPSASAAILIPAAELCLSSVATLVFTTIHNKCAQSFWPLDSVSTGGFSTTCVIIVWPFCLVQNRQFFSSFFEKVRLGYFYFYWTWTRNRLKSDGKISQEK